ncbi:pyridoxamine 5'-phosphate oxidase family protein [Nonomuraea endophytica]|uniref:pyridoxamine 5'-phosphate oxidase family protein n=1 Tax=Nonomuraea endophytica TaxID=714136 RepID=UPI0037C83423
MTIDSAGMQALSRGQCLRLLSSMPIGRVVFTDRALPAVQPVRFLMDGEHIVIRTVAGSKLAAATRDAIVAFEVDDFDPQMSSGWSVTAIGRARGVHDAGEIAHLSTLALIGGGDHFVVIGTEEISGRLV